MDKLAVWKTDRGRYAVRPIEWAGCWNENGEIKETLNHLAVFLEKEDAEEYVRIKLLQEDNKLIELPCAPGDTIYVIAECETIEPVLDGSMYSSDGSPGTATGYYCPYELCDKCPHDTDNCEECEKISTVFEDEVKEVWVDRRGEIKVLSELCHVCSRIGDFVFLTQEDAEKKLEEIPEPFL